MRQLENTRNQVQPSDQAEFDSRVAGIKLEALESIRSFSEVQRHYSKRPSVRTGLLGSDEGEGRSRPWTVKQTDRCSNGQ